MCKCKQAIEYTVQASIDEESTYWGYDGDLEPGTDTKGWVAYQLISFAVCTRCKAHEDRDALGGCWAVPEIDHSAYLTDTVRQYGMVPEGAEFELCLVW